ncbi:Ig-like domain-containing protein [Roseimarinus sediminis]|uniref:Ig-like domain-containing protein n=1 Tax=Roseimarinus sediminis TaxID=1610899 RepID=UPI003D25A282
MRTGLIVLLFIFLVAGARAQTPGLIIKPATGTGAAVLDPNGDGYSSVYSTGYVANDYEHTETELPVVTVVRPDPSGDPVKGPSGSFNDIVGTSEDGENAIFTYIDGSDNLIFRFRLDGYAPNSKTYSMLIDTDGKFGFTGADADPNAVTGNPGFEIEVSLQTNFGVFVYNIDGTASQPAASSSYTGDTNYQQSIAFTTNSSSPDYFYDFFVPLSALGVSSSTPLRYAALTTMNPNGGIGSNSQSDVGGTSEGSNLDNVFEDLIEDQTPTPPGEEVLIRSECPTITGPISTGATSVSGSSNEANGTVIEVYLNDVSIGTTTVSGNAWSLGSVGPFTSGDVLNATATAPGKGVSLSTCNLTFVGSDCTEIPGIVTIDNGNKGVTILNVADYPEFTVFTVYNAADDTEWIGNKADNNPYTISAADIANGTIDIGCGGQGNCMSDDTYYVIAQAPSTCPSSKVYFNVGNCTSTINAPAIDATAPNSDVVTGTLGVSGATLFLYADGILIGEKILTTNGAWSIYVNPEEICNITLTAQQIGSGTCLSDPSTGVLVGQGVTTPPVVDVDLCASSISTISGYSVEPDGTTIQVYVNAGLVGTTTVSGGAWSVSASASTGQAITATATNSNGCETVSPLSAAVTLNGTTTLSGTFTLGATIYDTTDPVPVNYNGLTASTSYTINLQIDGYTIGTTTFTSSGTGNGTVDISPTYSGDLYVGGALSVSLQQGSQCESSPFDLEATVQCQVPDLSSSVISAAQNNECITLSGEITLTNSEQLVIYTPVNAAGDSTGYSVLGTGGTITLYTFPFAAAGTETFYIRAERITASVACEAQSVAFVTFNAYGPPEITTQPFDQDLCYGDPTSITVEWTGEGPYNVQWQYNSGSGFTNLSDAGVYSQTSMSTTSATTSSLLISDVSLLDNYEYRCIITDLGVPTECRDSISDVSTFTVEYVYLSASSVSNATTGNNGAIDITAAGGDTPYSYDWHHINGSGTFGEIEDLTGLAEGTYTVTVKDANDCTWEESFTVLGPGSIDLAEVSTTQISCYGADDGAFEVVATLGTGPYIYSIDNFSTSQSSGVFEDLLPGTYTVRARDNLNANSNSVSIVITEPAEIVITATPSNPSAALTDGSITINLTGGIAPFNYELYTGTYPSGSLVTSNTNNNNSTYQFTGLGENTYYVVVTDDNACESVKTGIALVEPNISTESCVYVAAHSFNGTQASYSGYDGTYNFFGSNDWIEGTDNQNKIKVLGDALTFGNTDLNNLTLSGTSDISRSIDLTGATLDNTTPTISFDYSLTRGPNANKDDFGIRMYVNNAASPAFNIPIGSAQVAADNITLDETSTNVTFIDGINTFRFEIYDVAGGKYEANSYFNIDNFSISFSKDIVSATVASPSTCNNGSIELDVSGGFSPYSFDWDTDAANDFDDDEDLSGLSAGTYGLIIRDSRGCETAEITEIVESAPLTASITAGDDPTCAGGGSNGTITATVADLGGGGPFIYKLIKGTSDTIATAISALSEKTFTGLNSGTYKVRVWDVNNCNTLTGTWDLSLPALSSALSAVSSTTMCAGNSVTVKVDISGGTSPYIVVLSNGQSFTNYTSGTEVEVSPSVSTTISVSSVTDAISCVSGSNTGPVAITVIPAPVAPSSVQSDRDGFCADDAGSITLTATGGTGTTLQWFSGSCGGTPVGTGSPLVLASPTSTTTYFVRYENTCGESSCNSVTVNVNGLPLAPASTGNQTVCAGNPNPALNVNVASGATADWYSTASGGTALATGTLSYTSGESAAGTYTYYAEARNTTSGCTSTSRTPVSLTINPLPTPVLTSSDADNTICSGESVTFTASGGSTYEFKINGITVQSNSASTSYTTSTLSDGDVVTVVVTSAQGCTATSAGLNFSVSVCNTPPVANNDSYSLTCTSEASGLDLLANDSDDSALDLTSVILDPTGAPVTAGNTYTDGEGNEWTVTTSGLLTVVPASACSSISTTYTVKDDTGQTSNTASITITFNDATAPVFSSCPGTQTVNANYSGCIYEVNGAEFDPVASDNCTVSSLTHNYDGGGSTLDGKLFPEGTTTVVWTATDACGNSSTCTYDVTVKSITVTVELVSSNNDCPELIANQGFNPENTSYDAGATEVIFRVTLNNSDATTWNLDYNIGATVDVRTGGLYPSPNPQSFNNYQVNNGTNTVDLIFYINNDPGNSITPVFTVTSVTDEWGCNYATDESTSVIIKAMPEVGAFN